MSGAVDPKAIASRIREILEGQDRAMIEAMCRRLNVSEAALRMTIDENEPHPVVELIAAVSQRYAVDPARLLSGEPDAAEDRAPEDVGPAARLDMADLIARHLSELPPSTHERSLEA